MDKWFHEDQHAYWRKDSNSSSSSTVYSSLPAAKHKLEQPELIINSHLQQQLHQTNMHMNGDDPHSWLRHDQSGHQSSSSSSMQSFQLDAFSAPLMTQAMMIAASSNVMYHFAQEQAHDHHRSRTTGADPVGAFKVYRPRLGAMIEPRKVGHGQKMIKTAFSVLQRIHMARCQYEMQERQPTGNQLQHMISERRRREKLNDSFHALKMILPPGSKKDKASILSRANEYVNTLKAKVTELEEKNRTLEKQIDHTNDRDEEEGSSERVEIKIEQAKEQQEINLRVIVRVECNMADVILGVLQRLKQLGDFCLLSMNSSSSISQASTTVHTSLTFQLKSSNLEEELLKEGVMEIIKDEVFQSVKRTT